MYLASTTYLNLIKSTFTVHISKNMRKSCSSFWIKVGLRMFWRIFARYSLWKGGKRGEMWSLLLMVNVEYNLSIVEWMGSPLQICTPQHFPLLVWQHLFMCIDFWGFWKSLQPEKYIIFRSFLVVLYPIQTAAVSRRNLYFMWQKQFHLWQYRRFSSFVWL